MLQLLLLMACGSLIFLDELARSGSSGLVLAFNICESRCSQHATSNSSSIMIHFVQIFSLILNQPQFKAATVRRLESEAKLLWVLVFVGGGRTMVDIFLWAFTGIIVVKCFC